MRSITRRSAMVLAIGTLLAVAPAQNVPYGTSSPDINGVHPRIYATQAWMGNGGFGIGLYNAVGGSNAALGVSVAPSDFLYGVARILIEPQDPFLVLLVPAPTGGTVGVPGSGSAFMSFPLTFPPDPMIAGANAYAQWIVEQPGSPGYYSATRGMRIEITEPPLIFVGTSVGGNVDPYAFVDPATASVVASGGLSFTDNVTDAVFANGGNQVYVATGMNPGVHRAVLNAGVTPSWSSFYTASGACYGLGLDWKRKYVYTLAGPNGNMRELKAVDVDPASSTYGLEVATTVNLSGGVATERWALSPSCDLAAVPASAFGPGNLHIVDTNPTNPTFLQAIQSPLIPTTPGAIMLPVGVGFGTDDRYVYVVLLGFSGVSVLQQIAKYDILVQTWVDFDPIAPGQQHLNSPINNPARIAMSKDGSFMLLASSTGIGRIDFSEVDPAAALFTPWLPGSPLLAGANGVSLNGDDTLASFTSTNPSKVILVDVASGALVNQVALPAGMSNIYTTAWR